MEPSSPLTQSMITFLQSWNTNFLFITLASFLAWIAWRIIYNRLEYLSKKTNFDWDDLTLNALKTPISALIWCWPATVSLDFFIQEHFGIKLGWLSTLKLPIVIAILAWITIRFINNVESFVLQKKTHDETTVHAGSVRIWMKCSRVRLWSSTRMGKRPWSSGMRSLGLET